MSLRSPLLWRATHEAIVSAKDAHIRILNIELERLHESFKDAQAASERRTDLLTNKLAEIVTPKLPPAPEPRRKRPVEEKPEEPKTTNLREVDPDDYHQLAALALKEVPNIGGRVPAHLLKRKMAEIRNQVLQAQSLPEAPVASVPVAEKTQEQMSAEEKIEAAVQRGIELAQGTMKVGA